MNQHDGFGGKKQLRIRRTRGIRTVGNEQLTEWLVENRKMSVKTNLFNTLLIQDL